MWNADDQEVAELYTSVRDNAPDADAHMELCNKLYAKYCFAPSRFEEPDFTAGEEGEE